MSDTIAGWNSRGIFKVIFIIYIIGYLFYPNCLLYHYEGETILLSENLQ